MNGGAEESVDVGRGDAATGEPEPTPAEANCFDNNSFPEPEDPSINIQLPKVTPFSLIKASSSLSIPVDTISTILVTYYFV